MKKISISILFFIFFSSISFAQYPSNNLPVDTITVGAYDDHHPVLSKVINYNNIPQWLLFERYTNDSSFIIGKRFIVQKNVWDSTEVVIASSTASSPLTYPDIAVSISSPLIYCAVWQKTVNNIGSIYYSFYPDSTGHWTVPTLLSGDSLSNEHPSVRMMHINFQKNFFTVMWSGKNMLLHSLVSPSGAATIDTIVHTKIDQPKFDFGENFNADVILVYSAAADSGGVRFCKTIFSEQPFALKSTDTLPGIIETESSPRFVQSYGGTGLVWEENKSAVQRIVGTSVSNFSPQPILKTVTGKKYDVRTYSSPMTTLSEMNAFDYVYFNVLTYTWDNGIDTALMIHNPGMMFADTIRCTGYNSSSAIGSFICFVNGTAYTLVVWESNRTGRSHIYGKLVYSPIGEVQETGQTPDDFLLEQNYPNPFNPTTVIRYQLPVNSHVTLKVYDVLGREVAMLVNEIKEVGKYSIQFNGSKHSSGIYFMRLQSGENIRSMKMVLLK